MKYIDYQVHKQKIRDITDQRDKDIYAEYQKLGTLEKVAQIHDLTRQRISQIIQRYHKYHGENQTG